MKTVKELYLLVDVNELKKLVVKKDKKKLFSMPKYELEKIDGHDIFGNLPEEYQKIVVVIHKPLTSFNEAEEFLSEIPFDISGYTKIVDDPAKQKIKGCDHKNDIIFSTPANFKDFDEVNEFYTELKQKHIYNYYVKKLFKYFNQETFDKSKRKTKKKMEY